MNPHEKSTYCTPEAIALDMYVESTLCQSDPVEGGNDDIGFGNLDW